MTDTADRTESAEELDHVVIRFAGDSGDGMQLTGDRFTGVSALLGNDLATLPEYPAEIRAPQGTLAGVSAFQVHISDHEINTPGDAPDVLVAMNPAALKNELHHLPKGGVILVNEDTFEERNFAKAGYETNPLEDGSLGDYTVYRVAMTTNTTRAVEATDIKKRDAERSKNFYALGLLSWMYSRPLEPTLDWIQEKFGKNDAVLQANTLALKAGHAFGETAELFAHKYRINAAEKAPGVYTNIAGNVALAWGLVAASHQAKLPLFLGSYPITPASDVLHELSKYKNFGVRTLQAEDEIAGVGAALGAAFGGHLAVTTTSGPGIALKSETISLAISLELPLLIIDIQRGGPSTGLPTKTEQSDLLQAMYGRHGESPIPIVAPYSSAQCFDAAIEAARIALKYRTPVMLLSDGYIANGTEPWLLPNVEDLPDISVDFATEFNHRNEATGEDEFWPYLRNPETLARPWAVPGTPNLMHRIGGIEKEDGSGNISYDPDNHQRMTELRAAKVAGISDDIPPAEVFGDVDDADLLVVGWGSTWGAVLTATDRARNAGLKVARVHLTHLNPFPANLGEVLSRYPRVLCPEMNLGQLATILRAKYLVNVRTVSKVKGTPFTAAELVDAISGAIHND